MPTVSAMLLTMETSEMFHVWQVISTDVANKKGDSFCLFVCFQNSSSDYPIYFQDVKLLCDYKVLKIMTQ